jgi:hypothetical protein
VSVVARIQGRQAPSAARSSQANQSAVERLEPALKEPRILAEQVLSHRREIMVRWYDLYAMCGLSGSLRKNDFSHLLGDVISRSKDAKRARHKRNFRDHPSATAARPSWVPNPASCQSRNTAGFGVCSQIASRRGRTRTSRASGAALIQKRDQFVARRIGTTLARGELGVLFLGMLHSVATFLPAGIRLLRLGPSPITATYSSELCTWPERRVDPSLACSSVALPAYGGEAFSEVSDRRPPEPMR